VPNDARNTVLYAISRQARKAKDGLDHRSLSELAASLRSLHYSEIRSALAELQDEGIIQRGMSSRGEGWGLAIAVESCEEKSLEDLTSPQRGRVASHTGCGTRGVVPGVAHTGDDSGGIAEGYTGIANQPYSTLLRTSSGGSGEVHIFRGRDIVKRKRSRLTDPDSPVGLAKYFGEVAVEKGFTWGETNVSALAHWFKTAKEAGMSPEEVRKLIRLFWMKPEVIRGAGKPPWRLFLNQREALAKQAGVHSHHRVIQQPVAESDDDMKARYLAYWTTPEPDQTPEEIAAEKARYLSHWID
jgi:hypothetical protein